MMTRVDCVFGLLMALGAVIGTVIGLVIGFVSHPEHPRFDGGWLLLVVPIAAYFVGGAVITSALDMLIRRFRPEGEADVLMHDGPGTDPPAHILLLLGTVSLLAPALVAIAFTLFAAGLVP
jgi:hypothetical protein